MNKELSDYLFYLKENNTFHTTQSIEAKLSNAIASGNEAEIKALFSNGYNGALGTLSLNNDRQNRYMFVTMSAVFSRAAMQGGVNYELACSMADVYCQKMDKLANANNYMELGFEMALDFCNAVRETKKSVYSSVVNKCCEYIYNHTHEQVDLDTLSALTGISTRRLSQKFKTETGISIVDYIQISKIDEAMLLLTYTSKTINEISSYLAFSSQSYFTKIFKKHVGYTPYEYQNIVPKKFLHLHNIKTS